jgi:ATP-dependent helicase/nuclease subunit A
MTRSDASLAQIRAADPASSTWLSANAGSGKTRVLIDRVARLLLEGAEPQRILCLTYTKAAATEMQNRLFDRLGRWAMLPEPELRIALGDVGIESTIDAATLASARRLFARAIEAPGGLKIQTIHSFCSGVLRRFPLEAGISPNFTEIDEHGAKLLRRDTAEEIAARTPYDFDDLAGLVTDERIDTVLAEIIANRDLFQAELSEAGAKKIFGLSPEFDATTLLAGVFLGGEGQLISALLPILRSSGSNDNKLAAKLSDLGPMKANTQTLEALENALLYKKKAKSPFGAKIGDLPTKDVREGNAAALMPEFNAFMKRVETARTQRVALDAAMSTAALHRFARVFLSEYDAAKSASGSLDFDDLIRRTSWLLADSDMASWVLFRLDGGIDHILVDEAQDTSPEQWRIIERLSEEFTAGQGASDKLRTIFVVGDMKQSIYSFQGADLRAFEEMRDHFAKKHAALATPYQTTELIHSFRSSSAILDFVDLAFDARAGRGLGGATKHRAINENLPGRVDLWSPVLPGETPDPAHWYDPVTLPPDDHHNIRLAERIAGEIRRLIDCGTQIPLKDGGSKALDEGDIIILVQRRSVLFHAIIRACKLKGLKVAGSDRLRLGAEIAVKDITALLSFLATPEDDLSLAAVLRSPLFGWSEDDLYRLAQPRAPKSFLWQELRDKGETYSDTVSVLADLRDSADFLRPYELIERMLTRHDGRCKLIGRLGVEAEDGIDALLDQSLEYERGNVPSLTGFLAWIETDEAVIKRRLEVAKGTIRVMTVHGAKGLEAPVVILPDTEAPNSPLNKKNMLQVGDSAVWKSPADASPEATAAAKLSELTLLQEERMRLLYVAMTRAQVWLIVATSGKPKDGPESWYWLLSQAMEHSAWVALPSADPGYAPGKRFSAHDWPETETARAGEEAGQPEPDLPDWFDVIAPNPEIRSGPLSPSNLGGAKALAGEAGEDEETAKRHGTLVHMLLEVLPEHPQGEWPAVAARLLESQSHSALLEPVFLETQKALTSPDLVPLLAADTFGEVPVSAHVAALGGRLVHGTIDRLAILPDRILAVDYKTNRVVPSAPEFVPDGLLRQMGAYAEMLATIYPGRKIETAIFWTRTARMMPLPHDMVRQALQSTTIP